VIEVTEEMKAAFRVAQEKRAAELVADGAPLGGHDILDRGLAAVLIIVERDFRILPARALADREPTRINCSFCMTGLAAQCPWHNGDQATTDTASKPSDGDT
jgi:hypothetical protein